MSEYERVNDAVCDSGHGGLSTHQYILWSSKDTHRCPLCAAADELVSARRIIDVLVREAVDRDLRDSSSASSAPPGGRPGQRLLVHSGETMSDDPMRDLLGAERDSRRSDIKPCGCEQRGKRLFRCQYHEGYEDGAEVAGEELKAAVAEIERLREENELLRVEGRIQRLRNALQDLATVAVEVDPSIAARVAPETGRVIEEVLSVQNLGDGSVAESGGVSDGAQ